MAIYVELACKDYCALVIKAESDEKAERIMQSVLNADLSDVQRYYLLAMEDLE